MNRRFNTAQCVYAYVYVCVYWGSCQHGRDRTVKWTALEPARPPTARHSTPGAAREVDASQR